ncbi:SpoIIE family protein phosphatase [uncultured Methanobrevibacter sp.]|uniref:SpoIIE family protein phosphatase n=1 Tax=uncultured Methanobrevibacter sp. TaxID=253161 RepID=UPI0025FC586E|nr:PP2C family protein-serine/threonine phosphatase [uncultured Methanobrevibacter sp.]
MPYGGEYIVADVGIAPVFGMMFGPVGGLGQALASLTWQLCEGVDPIASAIDCAIMFFISIIAYKLWYTTFKEAKINTPKFNSTYNLLKFLIIALIVSIVYWALIYISFEAYHHMYVIYPLSTFIAKTAYVLNLFNFTLIFGIFFISIFNIEELPMHRPEKWINLIDINDKYFLGGFILLAAYVTLVQIFNIDNDITDNIFFGWTVVMAILFCLNKFEPNIEVRVVKYSIIEKIILFFLIILSILFIVIFDELITISMIFTYHFNEDYIQIFNLCFGSGMMILFCMFHIYHVERTITNPIYGLIDSLNHYQNNENTEPDDNYTEKFEKYLKNNDDMSRLIESFITLRNNIENYLNNLKKTTAEKEKIETEFKIASNIQSGMLKTNFDEFSNDKPFEIYGLMEPAKEVGGAFYDYFNMDGENAAFVIGDTGGTGVSSTLFMVKTMQLIENHSKFDPDLEKLFENVNDLSFQRNDDKLFVTSWFGKLNFMSGKLSFVNAGHNPPLVKHDNQDFEYLKIKPDYLLGGMENAHYKKHELDLSPGDMVFLYTDGAIGRKNNPESYCNDELLKETVNKYKDEKLENMIEGIKNDLNQAYNYDNPIDDITMLVIKYNGRESYE